MQFHICAMKLTLELTERYEVKFLCRQLNKGPGKVSGMVTVPHINDE